MSDEIDLDDFDDFDFGDDIDGDDMSNKVTDDRKPTARIGEGLSNSIKDNLTSPDFIKNNVRKATPTGFNPVIDKASTAASASVDLYNDALKKAKPGIQNAKKLVRSNQEALDKFLPKSMSDWIREKTKAEEQRTTESKEQIESMAIETAIASMFATKQDSEDKATEGMYNELKLTADQAQTASLKTISNNLSRIAGFNEGAMSQYIRKSLEVKYRHYFISRDHLAIYKSTLDEQHNLLRAIAKNTALPEEVKRKTSEFMMDTMQARMFTKMADTVGSYRARFIPAIKAKVSGRLSEYASSFNDIMEQGADLADSKADMAEMGIEQDDMEGAGRTIGDIGLNALGDKAMRKLAGILESNPRVKKAMDDAQYYGGNLESIILDWKRNGEDSDGMFSGVFETIKELIPELQKDQLRTIDFTDSRDFEAKREEMKYKSITQIIPEHLAAMRQTLERLGGDGDAEKFVFDPTRNVLVRESEMDTSLDRKVIDRTSVANISGSLSKAIQDLQDSTGVKMTAAVKEGLRERLFRDGMDGSVFDPTRYADASTYDKSMDTDTAQEVAEYMRNAFFNEEGTYKDDGASSVIRNKLARAQTSSGDVSPYDTIQNLQNYGFGEQLARMGITKRSDVDGKQVIDNEMIVQRYLALMDDYEGIGSFEYKDTSKMTPKQLKAYNLALKEYKAKTQRIDIESDGSAIAVDDEPEKSSGSIMDRIKAKFTTSEKPSPSVMRSYTVDRKEGGDTDRYMEALTRTISDLSSNLGDVSLESTQREIKDALLQLSEDNKVGFASVVEGLAAGVIAGKVEDPKQSDGVLKGMMGKAAGLVKGIPIKSLVTGYLGNSFRFAKIAQSVLTGKLGEVKDRITEGLRGDLYLEDMDRPIITANDFKIGRLLDVRTGKVIRSHKDITGKVVDTNTGETVLTEDQAHSNFKIIGPLGKVMAIGKNTMEGGLNAAQSLKDKVISMINPEWGAGVKEIFTKDGNDPILKSAKLRARRYLDVTTGKIVQSISDIKGAVMDTETGETVITEEEAKAGLREGRDGTLLSKLLDVGGGGVEIALAGIDRIRRALGHDDNGNKEEAEDVYVGGERSPRLLKYLMEKGQYFDDKGNPIHSLKDITGKVFDASGQLVMDVTSGIKPFIVRQGRRVDLADVGAKMTSGFDTIKNIATTGLNKALGLMTGINDMMFNGMSGIADKVNGMFTGTSNGKSSPNETLDNIYAILKKWDLSKYGKGDDDVIIMGYESQADVLKRELEEQAEIDALKGAGTEESRSNRMQRNKGIDTAVLNGDVDVLNEEVESLGGERLELLKQKLRESIQKGGDALASAADTLKTPKKDLMEQVTLEHGEQLGGYFKDAKKFITDRLTQGYEASISRAVDELTQTGDVDQAIRHLPEGPEKAIVTEAIRTGVINTKAQLISALGGEEAIEERLGKLRTSVKKGVNSATGRLKAMTESMGVTNVTENMDILDDIYGKDHDLENSLAEDLAALDGKDTKASVMTRLTSALERSKALSAEQLANFQSRVMSSDSISIKYLREMEQSLIGKANSNGSVKRVMELLSEGGDVTTDQLSKAKDYLSDKGRLKEDLTKAKDSALAKAGALRDKLSGLTSKEGSGGIRGSLMEYGAARAESLRNGFRNTSDWVRDSMRPKDDEEDEIRAGSWQEQKANAEKKKKADRENRLINVLTALAGKLKGDTEKDDDSPGFLSGLMDKIKGLGGGLGLGGLGGGVDIDLGGDRNNTKTKPKGRVGKFFDKMKGSRLGKIAGKAGGLLKKIPGAGLVGKVASGLGKTAMTVGKVGMGAAGMVGGFGGVASMLGTGLAAIGSGALAALSSPVALGGLAAAAVGYGGYKLYKHITKVDVLTGLDEIRMAQYGMDFTDNDNRAKIMKLEALLDPKVKLDGDPRIDFSEEDLLSYYDIFGVDADDPQERALADRWLNERFKPAFLAHKLGLAGKKKTSELKGEEIKKYLSTTKVDAMSNSYDITRGPDGDPLINNKSNAIARWRTISMQMGGVSTEGNGLSNTGKAATQAATQATATATASVAASAMEKVTPTSSVTERKESRDSAMKVAATASQLRQGEESANLINESNDMMYQQLMIQQSSLEELMNIRNILLKNNDMKIEDVAPAKVALSKSTPALNRKERRGINVTG